MIDDAWSVLGIAPTDDARTVKRAYASRLKATRPDDDPDGFQALTDAYEVAMREAREAAERAMQVDDASEGDANAVAAIAESSPPVEVPQLDGVATTGLDSAPTAKNARGAQTSACDPHLLFADALPSISTAAPYAGDATVEGERRNVTEVDNLTPSEPVDDEHAFQFDAFFEAMCDVMAAHDANTLRAWLQGHDALYSIELKWAVMPYVFDAVARHAHELQPTPSEIDVLIDFFGVDARLRRHSMIAPALDYLQGRGWDPTSAPSNPQAEFDALVEHYRTRAKWADRLLLEELVGPRAMWRRMLVLAVPFLPSRTANLANLLTERDPDSAAATLDARAVSFWQRATNVWSLDPYRLLVTAVRLPILWLLACRVFSDVPGFSASGAFAALLGAAVVFVVGGTWWRRLVAFTSNALRWDAASTGCVLAVAFAAVLFATGTAWWGVTLGLAAFQWGNRRELAYRLWAYLAGGIVWITFITSLSMLAPDASWTQPTAAFAAVCWCMAIDVLLARRLRVALTDEQLMTKGPAWWWGASWTLAILGAAVAGLVG